jgi:ribosome-associated translation inhibitor RaiA
MKIDIRLRGMSEADQLRAHVQRQLHFHLARFTTAIGEVLVRVTDLNGPKGGVDKRCQILVRLERGGSITVHVDGADGRAAVDHAIERTVRMIARELARARAWDATG